jgi:hypothetical protein
MSANRPLPAALLALFVLAGCQESNTLLDFDGDGSLDQDDCNTTDPEIYPGAPDPFGDDLDSNCDGADGVDADGDGFAANAEPGTPDRDCDDSNAAWHPGAPDQVDADGADSNCDGTDGTDGDGDGWASTASGGQDCDDEDPDLTQSQDIDLDGISDCDGDCADTDASIYPGADEVCDGKDSDCDGTIPDDEIDGDEDGSLACDDCDDADASVERLDIDGDGITTCAGDCNDEAAPINPFEPDQVGDGHDTNCDGIDGIDADGDGFAGTSSGGEDCEDGDPAITPETDADADGTTLCAGDCDDSDAARSPLLVELCATGIDEDCDGTVDTDADLDGDGFSPCDGDCSETSSSTYPGAPDVWGDPLGLDSNCDGTDGVDGDGDGWASTASGGQDCDDTDDQMHLDDNDGDNFSPCAGDCDDSDVSIFPFASDLACDGIDSNCDADPEEVDTDLDGYVTCAPYLGSVPSILGGGDCDDEDAGLYPEDADGDGSTLCDGDCDDADPNRLPDASDLYCDGFDSDCVPDPGEQDTDLDGQLPCEGDCDDSDDTMYGSDIDGDGRSPCGTDGIAGTSDDDCDDGDNTVFPGATELCDGIDSDCIFDATELDQDGDGYVVCAPWLGSDPQITAGGDCNDDPATGTNNIPIDADSDGFSGCAGDCDETDPTIFPGAPDLACDGLDTDCVADTAEVDVDGDGYLACAGYSGTAVGILGGEDCEPSDPYFTPADVDGDSWSTCGPDSIAGTADDDCDDSNAAIAPYAVDAPCDGIDSDCIADGDEVDDDGDGYTECGPYTGSDSSLAALGGDCDDNDANNFPVDADGDGQAGCAGDCNENDASVYVGAPDLSCDGIDSNCVADANEQDADQDGFMPCEGDCDDGDGNRYPGAAELCNGIDDDCAGGPGPLETDNDGDGFTECSGNDCNDADPGIYPGAAELCDGIDNNCNGTLDDLTDGDSDGVTTCGPDGLPSTGDEDCNDSNASLNYSDLDGDGYVTCPDTGLLVAPLIGGDDCDDLDAARWPGNPLWESGYAPDYDCSGGFGNRLATVSHAHLVGEAAGDRSGYSVSSAGDVDGDGLDDLLVGAYYNGDGGTDAGKTYLFLGANITTGGSFQLSAADASFVGEAAYDRSGYSVSSAGDVDGDGLDDLLIGAVQNGDGGQFAGKTYLFLGASIAAGGSFNLSAADASFVGENGGNYSGRSVSSAGDVDGDGLDDLLIGAPDYGGGNRGKSYLFLAASIAASGTFSLSQADASFVGEDAGDESGWSVSSAGDVDGDGLSDLVIGAYRAGGGGKSYLFLGASIAVGGAFDLSAADAVFVAEAAYDWAGFSVASAGDVDGDGLSDLLMGAPRTDSNSDSSGSTYLFLGSSIVSGGTFDLRLAHATFRGVHYRERSGISVSSAGDVDGDGLDDIFIGADSDDLQANGPGWGVLFLGSTVASGGLFDLSEADVAFIADSQDLDDGCSCDHSGRSVSSAGDVDGDGLSDLLIGAWANASGGFNAGKTYLVLSSFSSPAYEGLWTLGSSATYSCLSGAVTAQLDHLNITHRPTYAALDPALIANAYELTMDPRSPQPGLLQGGFVTSATPDSFTLSRTESLSSGTCTATWALNGSYTDPDTITADFTATFTGSCGDCTNQSFPITATR